MKPTIVKPAQTDLRDLSKGALCNLVVTIDHRRRVAEREAHLNHCRWESLVVASGRQVQRAEQERDEARANLGPVRAEVIQLRDRLAPWRWVLRLVAAFLVGLGLGGVL